MVLGRGLVVAACAFALACGPAQAVTKTTARVPVTTPDEYGLPVTLEADAYLPDGAAPAGGWPLVEVFHGGASNKDNPFDAGHAQFFAEHGYAALTYSQRGQGGSDGQVAVAGPKEMRDLFDFAAAIPAGHRLVMWVTAGDAGYNKPYPGSGGGTLAAGPGSTVTVPLRT